MHFILGIVFCFIFGFLFWFIGHVTLKKLNILNEDNQLLLNLLKICLGASSFLIVINFVGNILKDFNWALIISFGIILGIIIWQLHDFKQICLNLKDFFKKANFQNFFKTHTDKYCWILFGGINFIYGLTAFSTVKLDRFTPGSGHVYNINQLLAGTYPLKYSFLPNIPQRYHYGSDIFGALISRFSGLHPEISLDILTLVFLNLSLLALYALTIKFLNTNPVNKYLVPFTAFLGWGPITLLFKKNIGEIIPTNFLDKINYLTQTRLIDAASWSGLTLHWFFAPPIGFSIFFFLMALYLLFRFFEGEQDLKFTLLLGIFLSSFVILDFSKFVILLFGTLVYLFFTLPIGKFDEKTQQNKTELKLYFKKLGILIISPVLLGLIYGNFLSFNKAYIPFAVFYNLGKTNMESKFSPFGCNIILLSIFIFGFYKAFKEKNKWINHLISFFAVSLILPYLVTIQDAGIGKILMTGNLIGVFTFPLIIDFIIEKFNFKEQKVKILYAVFFILTAFSTLMFWAFGDKDKPLFKISQNKIQYSKIQSLPYQFPSEEVLLAQFLKSQNIKNKSILLEPQYVELLSTNSGIINLVTSGHTNGVEVKKDIVDKSTNDSISYFSLNSKTLLDNKIGWIYVTPIILRYIMPPQARVRFLNAYLHSSVKSVFSNKSSEPTNIKELYEINARILAADKISSKGLNSFSKLKNKGNNSLYIKQIAECPYFGIYNSKSNDFDGDKIADVAFFSEKNKTWYIINGKDGEKTEINLSKNLLANYNSTDLLIPVPADYDGDSKTDIALFNRTTAFWNILRSSDSNVQTSSWGGLWGQIPLAADIDGDKKADTVAYTPGNFSNWGALLSTTSLENNLKFPSEISDIPVYADVDGDKKADNVIYKPQENNVYVYLSSKTYNQDQAIKLMLGTTTSRIVPADYDGDGKTDIAVWTPESGTWEIALAKNLFANLSKIKVTTVEPIQPVPVFGCNAQPVISNSGIITACPDYTFHLGKNGDIPLPGDYNGDSRAEIAVYNPRLGKLKIRFNTGSQKTIDLTKYKNYTLANLLGV